MKAIAEIQVIPIGRDVSVRDEILRVRELLGQTDLGVETHANGTNVEGEMSEILAAVQMVHETLHAEGVVRLSTALKLSTQTDKEPSLKGKQL